MTKLAANQLGLHVARQVLDAARRLDVTIEGTRITIIPDRLPAPPWPPIELLREADDGPWPAPLRVHCTWESGSVDLELRVSYWRTGESYRHFIALEVMIPSSHRKLVWITVPPALLDVDSAEPIVRASTSPPRKQGNAEEESKLAAARTRSVVKRAGLPFDTSANVEAFRVRITGGAVLPSPGEAFKRLCMLALCKLPFYAQDGEGVTGSLPFQIGEVVIEDGDEAGAPEAVRGSGKRAGIWGLPGGVRQYKATLDALLVELARHEIPVEAFYEILRERYDVTGEASRKSYLMMLGALGMADVAYSILALTDEGRVYLETRDPSTVFERLHAAFIGMVELLVLASELGPLGGPPTQHRMRELLGVTWESSNQVNFRRNWLLSLGLTEREDDGDHLTELGEQILARHATEAAAIRERVSQLVDEDGPGEGEDGIDPATSGLPAGSPEVTPGLDAPTLTARGEPSAWSADRVDLRARHVAPFVTDLVLPANTIERAVAALSAGKHLLLVGPPGTAKTELAHFIAQAARREGYTAGAFVATAAADWTTFDTIGGYALQKTGELKFREGALLRAVSQWQWLIVDELNRADVDRAFGELMTVLAGRATDTSFELDSGKVVRIGLAPDATHPMPRTFRVIATMNLWDKTSLFRLSYAVQRRFAIVHVGIPDDHAYAGLVRKHASQPGPDAALSTEVVDALVRLFSNNGLLAAREIGPAVALDVIRYARRRASDDGCNAGDALAEAVAMYVLPQLEGLDQERAIRCYASAIDTIGSTSSAAGRAELRDRFIDLFPHVKLPE